MATGTCPTCGGPASDPTTATVRTEADLEMREVGACELCYSVCDADGAGHRPDCPRAAGLAVAAGHERCGGPCGLPLSPGESYETVDDSIWCVACAALAGTGGAR